MSRRFRAVRVIAARQVFESLVSPGFYVILSLSLALSCALAAGFAASIDTSGFNPKLSPLYDFISRLIVGSFGASFQEKLFAEGPLAFALLVSFLPMLVYLAVSSVFRFGHEKNAGAVELIVYGPADGAAYVLAAWFKDMLLSLVSLAVLSAALLAAAELMRLLPGRLFGTMIVVLPLACLSVFAYGALCSILASNATSALALFLGIQVVFFLLLAGSFAIVSGPVRSVSAVAAALLQWVSPFFYAGLCFRAAESGQWMLFISGSALLLLLCAVVLYAGNLVIRRTGVRA
jgi:hypothetical protein